MAGPPSTAYRLNYSRRRLSDDDLIRLKRELPLQKNNLTYEEVDFSNNELSSKGLRVIMDVCRRCPKLRVLKLYKNHFDDAGAEALADLCKHCTIIEEMHLSHNHFTAAGVEVLITAAEAARPANISPLWLRLEQNEIADPDGVFKELESRLSVCPRVDEVRCTVRTCCRRQKIHLPFFYLQRPSRIPMPMRSQQALGQAPRGGATPNSGPPKGEVSPTSSVFTPSRSVLPKSGKATNGGGSVWDSAGRRSPTGNNGDFEPTLAEKIALGMPGKAASPAATNGYPRGNGLAAPPASDGGAEDRGAPGKDQVSSETLEVFSRDALQRKKLEEDAPAGSPSATSVDSTAQRTSLVVDTAGRRRIMPKQLEGAECTSSQFVCPLCTFVIIKPVITSCSHLFCDACFKTWVQDQVNNQKKNMSEGGPVPLVPCPQPACGNKLRKRDIVSLDKADSTQFGAVQLLCRLRNNLNVRCVHHVEHFKLLFGQDAERVARETGMTCKWVGDINSYEEHVSKCQVELHLRGGGTDSLTDASPSPQASSLAPNSQKSSAAPAAAANPNSSPGVSGAGGDGAAKDPDSTGPQKAEAAPNEGEIRIVRYDYCPRETDKAQISLRMNDTVRIFEVTDAGWAAGVRLNKETHEEIGEAGWFPAGYLYPSDHEPAA